MVEIIDIDRISAKVKQIMQDIDEREKEKQKIREEIRKLQDSEKQFGIETKNNVDRQFSELEKQFTFIGDVRQKFDCLASAYRNAVKTQEEILSLYTKAFRRLSNDRIVIPHEVFDLDKEYGNPYYLTLYVKGFGYCYKTETKDGSSQFINDWALLRRIFSNPDIICYIQKSDKIEVFNAFSDAMSNWIDINKSSGTTKDEIENITIIKPVPYIRVRDNFSFNRPDIEQMTIDHISIKQDFYGGYQLEIGFVTKAVKDLKFGELYALAHVWKELEEQLDERIRKFESIAENNNLILNTLKRKISAHIVVDEL